MKTYLHTKTSTQMFKASLFINSQKVETTHCPSPDEWTDKTWYIYTVGCHLSIKSNEALICATTWMSLVNIMLTKIS